MDDDALMVVHGTESLAEVAGRAMARRVREVPLNPVRSVIVTDCIVVAGASTSRRVTKREGLTAVFETRASGQTLRLDRRKDEV